MTALEQGFTKLNLHHTTEDAEDHEEAAEENTGQPVVVEDLPSVPSVEISVEDANLEENFFLDIKTFLKEMQSVRKYVLARWSGKSDLMTKAFVTNIAIDIVRQKEREFDESLSRPPQYPADKYLLYGVCLLYSFIKRLTRRHSIQSSHSKDLSGLLAGRSLLLLSAHIPLFASTLCTTVSKCSFTTFSVLQSGQKQRFWFTISERSTKICACIHI